MQPRVAGGAFGIVLLERLDGIDVLVDRLQSRSRACNSSRCASRTMSSVMAEISGNSLSPAKTMILRWPAVLRTAYNRSRDAAATD
jgi:hypothetical protein